MLGGSEREDALLGAALFLVAPRAAKGGIELVFVQGLLERLGLHDVGMYLRAMYERIDAVGDAVLIDVYQQLQAAISGDAVAKFIHLPEFPGRIDVQQRKRRRCRVESLAGQMQ